jgi:hypothetical protein
MANLPFLLSRPLSDTLITMKIGPDVFEGAAAKVLGVWISHNGCQSHKCIRNPDTGTHEGLSE